MNKHRLPLIGLAALLSTTTALAGEKHATGYLPEAPQAYAAMPKTPLYRAFLPPEADLSARFPTPGNQGRQGSCTAWATSYAARSYHEARRQGWNPDDPAHQFSPAFIYNQVKARDCHSGSAISNALQLLKDTGAAPLAEFPYDDDDCSRQPDAELVTAAARYRIDDWRTVDTDKLDDLKGQIAIGNPVIFGMDVSDSFEDLDDDIYNDLTSPRTGGHAMVLVGYSEPRRAFKLINSWGTRWGDGGFGWVSYAAFQKWTHNAFVMNVAAPSPPPPAPEPAPAPPIPDPPPPVVVPPPPPEPEPQPPAPVVIPSPPPQPEPPPPEPPPEPEPEPKPPVVVPPPKPQVRPATPAELQRRLTALTSEARCAALDGSVTADHRVTLRGFAGYPEDLAQIQAELEKLGARVTLATELRPWPQCEALLTFSDALAEHSGLRVAVMGADARRLTDGDNLALEVTTPAYPSHLYLTYITANGDAVHLVRPQGRFPKPLAPNTRLVFGNGSGEPGQLKLTVSAPFGHEMVVAIATASPLFSEELPKTQIERDYLTQFRQAFLVKPEPGAPARVVSAAVATLLTHAKP
ncbi:C1 family peptidase [Methylomagnum sp.]